MVIEKRWNKYIKRSIVSSLQQYYLAWNKSLWFLHKLTLQTWHSKYALFTSWRGSFFIVATQCRYWQYLHFCCACGINLCSPGRNQMWLKVESEGIVLLKRSCRVQSRCITGCTSPNGVACRVTGAFLPSSFAQQMSELMNSIRNCLWSSILSFSTRGCK